MTNASYWLFGTKLRILKNEKETDSHYDLIEGVFPPASQSPLHVHANYSETVIVLEGEVTVYTPGEEHTLKQGESYFIPKNVPHVVANGSSSLPFKALAIASPSGFAELIRSVGIEDKENSEVQNEANDMQLAISVMTKLGDTILGPPGTRP